MVNLNDLQDLLYEEYEKNGYDERWNEAEKILLNSDRPELSRIVHLAEVGLFITEVSEALEEIRGKHKDRANIRSDQATIDRLGFELADIFIRTVNYASRLGFSIEYYVLSKHAKNLRRTKLHGRKI
jgi:NTP pyrophosphatase (non-canonical NTP hydrolase)